MFRALFALLHTYQESRRVHRFHEFQQFLIQSTQPHQWTLHPQKCACCGTPALSQEAHFCFSCGQRLSACSSFSSDKKEQAQEERTIDPLQLMTPGTLVRTVYQESRTGVGGTNTQVLRAIRKIQLQKEKPQR